MIEWKSLYSISFIFPNAESGEYLYNESKQIIQRESNEESHVASNVHQKVQVVKNYQYQILEELWWKSLMSASE